MHGVDEIKVALERNVRAVTLRPSIGQGTTTTVARLKPQLECEVTEGTYRFTAGMAENNGGNGAGPTPGVFGRGAIASCLAIGYAMWAARMGIPIDALEVELESDYDVRGELGIDESIPPGSLGMRCTITIDSPASDEQLHQLAEQAERASSWLDNTTRAVALTREFRISRTSAR